MRKSQEALRFPQSVHLFKFCFRILEIRKSDCKLHDQDLGEILNFNPSDTSHWKKGKKAIRNLQSLEKLASYLNVDLEILLDLSDGKIDIDEAWSDFYDIEEERKLLQKSTPSRIERRDRTLEIERISKEILTKLNIHSVPIYIPELLNAFPFIQLIPADISDKLARSSRVKLGFYVIRYRKGDVRAHTRIAIAREIAKIILLSECENFSTLAKNDVLLQTEIIALANALLIPKDALTVETQKISTRLNIVKSLAELFWVPKSVIRTRFTSIFLENTSDEVFESRTNITSNNTSPLFFNTYDVNNTEDDIEANRQY